MFRGKHVVSSLAAVLSTVALSTAGCSDPAPATPRVVLETELRIGSNSSQTCPNSGPLFTIGDFGSPGATPPIPVNPIENGQTVGSSTATVSCSVTAAGGGGFDVRASAQLSGATGGLFSLEGRFTPEGQQKGIKATFSKAVVGVFTSNDCVVDYTTEFQGVAAGRVWGVITCPAATRSDTGSVCESIAQFRFENCAQ